MHANLFILPTLLGLSRHSVWLCPSFIKFVEFSKNSIVSPFKGIYQTYLFFISRQRDFLCFSSFFHSHGCISWWYWGCCAPKGIVCTECLSHFQANGWQSYALGCVV